MTKEETTNELEQLRAEVAHLKQAQQQEKAQVAEELSQQAASEETNTAEENVQATEAASDDVTEQEQLDELKALLAKEIKDLPTVTTLAVFSLGLLMGRYLR